ncbi:MAG: hypothetical protein ACRENY_08065 [Candidatus Dormibacteria bacterium]
MVDPTEKTARGELLRVPRAIPLLIGLLILCFLMFAGGAALLLVTFAHNSQTTLDCSGLPSGVTTSCAVPQESYLGPGILLAVGFIGLLLISTVVSYVVARRWGAGLFTRRRRLTEPSAFEGGPGLDPPSGPGYPMGMPPGPPPANPGAPEGPPFNR